MIKSPNTNEKKSKLNCIFSYTYADKRNNTTREIFRPPRLHLGWGEGSIAIDAIAHRRQKMWYPIGKVSDGKHPLLKLEN